MGMPVTIEIVDGFVGSKAFDIAYNYLEYIDNKFSTYKRNSEISLINRGKLKKGEYSSDMKEVFRLSEETKKLTNGYFDILHEGKYDPSGIVKGWAILNVARLLEKMNYENFYLDAGGDIQTKGVSGKGLPWVIGIRNPFDEGEVVKVISVKDKGVATSGNYIRGNHIYNPKFMSRRFGNSFLWVPGAAGLQFFPDVHPIPIVSLTVVGPNIYEADRFATAAFAMGEKGIDFIEGLSGFEGYMIKKNGEALETSGFKRYVKDN
jgi:thiamine biosynthesis lipoprotein